MCNIYCVFVLFILIPEVKIVLFLKSARVSNSKKATTTAQLKIAINVAATATDDRWISVEITF